MDRGFFDEIHGPKMVPYRGGPWMGPWIFFEFYFSELAAMAVFIHVKLGELSEFLGHFSLQALP